MAFRFRKILRTLFTSCPETHGWKDILIWKHRWSSTLKAPALASLLSKTHIVPDIYCNAPHLNFLPSMCWIFEGVEWNVDTKARRQWRKLGMSSASDAELPLWWCLTSCAHCWVPTRLLRPSSLLVARRRMQPKSRLLDFPSVECWEDLSVGEM